MTYIYLVREHWGFYINEPDEYVDVFLTEQEATTCVRERVAIHKNVRAYEQLEYVIEKKALESFENLSA
tara:strand:+ start:653 stop:859 length:207 start_codon:yes stop_codon:yes gene_type:complete